MISGTGEDCFNEKIVSLSSVAFEKISIYDQKCYPAKREEFLKEWLKNSVKSVAYCEENEMKGYGVLRRGWDTFRIGPWFADSKDIAEEILKSLIGSLQSNEVATIDIPDINKSALELSDKFNMKVGPFTLRMYKGEIPKIVFDKFVFGITSLDFG